MEIRGIIDRVMGFVNADTVEGQIAKDLTDLCAFASSHMTWFDKLNGIPLDPEVSKELSEKLEEAHEEFMKKWQKKHPGLRKGV